jgi:uncharacterized protein YcbK (DUF882 family)
VRRLVTLLLLLPLTAQAAEAADELSKKGAFLKEKADRKDLRATRPPRNAAEKVLTLRNVWTHESLPVVVGKSLETGYFDKFVRCHHTNQTTAMDGRLMETIVRAASKFGASYVEVVSGFRAPKYQLVLRKKGREVARDSEHPKGQAVDFRIPTIPTKTLLKYVKSLHLGGVGYYPESKFVHADVGRVRFWRGH